MTDETIERLKKIQSRMAEILPEMRAMQDALEPLEDEYYALAREETALDESVGELHYIKQGKHEWYRGHGINKQYIRDAFVHWYSLDATNTDCPTVKISNGGGLYVWKFPVEYIGDKVE